MTIEEYAKKASVVLRMIRPLAGSEIFIKVGDQYLADPEACSRMLGEMINDLY